MWLVIWTVLCALGLNVGKMWQNILYIILMVISNIATSSKTYSSSLFHAHLRICQLFIKFSTICASIKIPAKSNFACLQKCTSMTRAPHHVKECVSAHNIYNLSSVFWRLLRSWRCTPLQKKNLLSVWPVSSLQWSVLPLILLDVLLLPRSVADWRVGRSWPAFYGGLFPYRPDLVVPAVFSRKKNLTGVKTLAAHIPVSTPRFEKPLKQKMLGFSASGQMNHFWLIIRGCCAPCQMGSTYLEESSGLAWFTSGQMGGIRGWEPTVHQSPYFQTFTEPRNWC